MDTVTDAPFLQSLTPSVQQETCFWIEALCNDLLQSPDIRRIHKEESLPRSVRPRRELEMGETYPSRWILVVAGPCDVGLFPRFTDSGDVDLECEG